MYDFVWSSQNSVSSKPSRQRTFSPPFFLSDFFFAVVELEPYSPSLLSPEVISKRLRLKLFDGCLFLVFGGLSAALFWYPIF